MVGLWSHRLRLLLWLVLLLAVALAAQSVVVAHRTRTRGLSAHFPAPVAAAGVPMLGVNVALEQYDDEGLEAALARIAEGGFVWVRQPFYWSQIEPAPGRFDWTVPDRILAALARHPALRLIAVLDDSRSTVPASTGGAEAVPLPDPDRFAVFAGRFAARYGAQVDDYQVWDEPNLAGHWGGGPVNPPAYADLLARTARAIRAADRSSTSEATLTGGFPARILLAGLAPTVETGPQNLSDVRYLEQLYQAGAALYFDVVAGKPYGFDTGPDDRRATESVLNFSRLVLLREVMVAHGDAGKAVWASHWGWNALPPGWAGAPSVWGQTDEATQAARTVAALARARAEWPWAGAAILEHWQPFVASDDAHWGFAVLRPDGTPRPVYEAVAAWAAALPEGARPGGYPADNPWTTYVGDWRVGPLGADAGSDGDRATFRFDGTSVALTVRRGPYRAFLYVTVDGAGADTRPANGLPQDEAGRAYVVLYDRAPAAVTIPLATGLAPGLHTVEVVAERGQGQWVLVDWRVGGEPVRDGYAWQVAGLAAAGLVLVALLVCDARRVNWTALGQRFLGWPEQAQVALAVALTGLLWVTAALSWGRDVAPGTGVGSPFVTPPGTGAESAAVMPPGTGAESATLVVSLFLLPVLAFLFGLRPDLGLALVAFAAPFYLHPGPMLYRALSLPEALVVVCLVGQITQHATRSTFHVSRFTFHVSRFTFHVSRFTFHASSLDHSVLLLLVAAVVAGVAAADRGAAFLELRSVFLIPALYYVLLRQARLDGKARWRVVDGWVLGGLGVALVGLVQYALGRNLVVAEGGLARLQSVYYSPNNVGLYLGRIWPLPVAVALWGGRGRRRLLYGLALVPVTLALVLSFSRGALLLGLPAAVLVMGWRAGGRYRWAALALIVAGALVLLPLLSLPRFAALFDLREGSTFFRLALWRSSAGLVREHPWFGVGPGNFAAAYRTRYMLPSAWSEPNLEHPHNIYLDHWTRLGLLGLVAGLLVQVAFWRVVFSRSQPPSSGAPRVSRSQPPSPGASRVSRSQPPSPGAPRVSRSQPPSPGAPRVSRSQPPSPGAPRVSRSQPPSPGAPRSLSVNLAHPCSEVLRLGLAGSMAALLAHGLVDNTVFFPDLALVFFLTLALVQWADTSGGGAQT